MDQRPELFSAGALERFAALEGYRTARPFPHAVFDGLFDPAALRTILDEWPTTVSNLEVHNDGTFSRHKLGTKWNTQFGPDTKAYFAELASASFLLALEKITGMWGLIADPYMFGGGLHKTSVGGSLAIHADFNKHPKFALDRRLNLLVYLNETWQEEFGGHLELWDRTMQHCEQRFLPTFNRAVLFTTNSTSYHGQPEPIVGPPDLCRKSIALYYYSNGRADEGCPPEKIGEHSTLWQQRPDKGY